METFADYRLIIAPMIPVAAALLIMAARRRPNLREGFSVAGAILTFATVCTLLPHVMAGGIYEYNPLIIYPGVALKFRLDGLGALFAVTSSFLWIMAAFYCIGYMRALNEHAQTRFYVCYAVSVGAGVGVAFSGSLFTLYLFYELISIFTYPLVMHHQDAEGYQGGRKYIIYLMFTSKAFLLTAMTLTYVVCGTLDFSTRGNRGIFRQSDPTM
jgi:multicomponent Na+:H+ antiporter subunit D